MLCWHSFGRTEECVKNVIQYNHFAVTFKDCHENDEIPNFDAACSVSYEFRMSDTLDIDLVCNRSITRSIQIENEIPVS
jgi:hypothetical protein